jgi:hypothetical protein
VVDGIEGKFWEHTSGNAIVARVAQAMRDAGVRIVHGDQRESLMLQAEFARHSIEYRVHDWTASSKPPAVERVRRLLADSALVLPPHEKMRRELLAFEERISASGSFTFGARGNKHDDYVALLITAMMADSAFELDGSPQVPPSGKFKLGPPRASNQFKAAPTQPEPGSLVQVSDGFIRQVVKMGPLGRPGGRF